MGRAALLCIAAVSLGQAACLVEITHVSDPSPIFDAARMEAERLTGQKGRAHELNVLVWSRHDRQLVRVAVPMWLLRKAQNHVDWEGADLGPDSARDSVRHALKGIRLEDIESAGLGVLAEVEGEDGEQVLVWLR